MDVLKFHTEIAKFGKKYIAGLRKKKPIITEEEFNAQIIRAEETLNRLYSIHALYYSDGVIDETKAGAIEAWAAKAPTPQGYKNLHRPRKK